MMIASDPPTAAARTQWQPLFATPDVDPALLSMLQGHGLAARMLDLAQLAAGPAEGVILWQDPVALIAEALLKGDDPVAACAGWLERAANLLELHRRNRRQMLLADAALLAPGAPEAPREALRARLGVPALPPPVPAAADPERQMALQLARVVLPRIVAVQDCLDALQSASLSVPPQEPGNSDLAALSRGMNRLQAAALKASEMTERAALLETQLDLQGQDSSRRIAALEARLQAATQEADRALSRALADLRAESKQRKALARQLDKIFASSSWRVTRPLRWIRSLFGSAPSAEEAFRETLRKHETRAS